MFPCWSQKFLIDTSDSKLAYADDIKYNAITPKRSTHFPVDDRSIMNIPGDVVHSFIGCIFSYL